MYDQMSIVTTNMGVPPAEFKNGNSLWKSSYLDRLYSYMYILYM